MLPEDPIMLMSAINMKLRDSYENLDELCFGEDVDKEIVIKKLKAAGFDYSAQHKRFY